MWRKFKTLFFEQFGYSCYGSSKVTRVSEVTPDDGKEMRMVNNCKEFKGLLKEI